MAVDKEFRNYKRFPIQIGRTTFALLHMFEYHPDHIEDIMLPDEVHFDICNVDYEASADQFIKQFEGNECRFFIEKLRDKCDEYIQKDLDKINKMNIKLGKEE